MKELSTQATLLWSGTNYHSLEHCLLTVTPTGIEASAIVIGHHESLPFKAEYSIRLNKAWETVYAEVKSLHNDKSRTVQLESDGNGKWTKNGNHIDLFDGCIDVDIPLTPFTNSLPVNRLKLQENQSQLIKVVYFDILAMKTLPVQQKYTRLSAHEYKYENVPNDFEAVITVDNSGLVTHYPDLFTRTLPQKTSLQV